MVRPATTSSKATRIPNVASSQSAPSNPWLSAVPFCTGMCRALIQVSYKKGLSSRRNTEAKRRLSRVVLVGTTGPIIDFLAP